METASKAKRNAEAKMSLEAYLLLIQCGSHLSLTVSHLNQIITMHGFKKIHKVHKKLLSDAVNSLELMNPCRSTLRDYISPPVTTKMEDVMADLSSINWQECCITAIETLGFTDQNQSAPPRNGAVQFEQYPLSTAAHSLILSAPPPSKRRSVRKRKCVVEVADLVNFI